MRALEVERKVRKFYETHGWKRDASGTYHEVALFEDLRPSATAYTSAAKRKVLEHLPQKGDLLLDAGSGAVQHPEYVEYSANFSKRVCVDLSREALEGAAQKLGSHGEYVQATILELPFPDDHFDTVMSLHTIYHIDRPQQEAAVRQLIRVAKPDSPIVIVYRNPNALYRLPLKAVPSSLKHRFNGRDKGNLGLLYYYAHPLGWWKRFSDQCSIKILPWAILTTREAKLLIPDNRLGELMFRGIMSFESIFPRLATVLGSYPLIVLKKKSRA